MAADGVHMLTGPQLKVLANPVREEILGLMCREALSAARLAERLRDPPANLHYHLERLRAVGLVELVETRPVRGATEKFFRAVAPSFSVAPEALEGLSMEAGHPLLPALRRYAAVVLDALGPALGAGASPAPLTSHQRLRLSRGAGERLRGKLAEWLEECRRAAEAEGSADDETAEWLLFAAFFRRVEER